MIQSDDHSFKEFTSSTQAAAEVESGTIRPILSFEWCGNVGRVRSEEDQEESNHISRGVKSNASEMFEVK